MRIYIGNWRGRLGKKVIPIINNMKEKETHEKIIGENNI